jgi:diguanylate cyclase (GGDEF)-like protein
LTYLIVDIDFFKQYNDTYGHQGGDECLRRVAESMRKTCSRAGDLVGRFGGEEFVALLPATNAEGGMLIAEAIRRNVEALAIEHAGSAVARVVTVSVGVTQMTPGTNVRLEDLFGQADAALYQAKITRNAVATYRQGDPTQEPTAARTGVNVEPVRNLLQQS